MYSVYSLTLNRYVEHQKEQESYGPLPLFTFYWQVKLPRRVYFIVVCIVRSRSSALLILFCFLAVKACLPLNRKFPLSSSWLSLASLDGLPRRATNLCIFAKSLFNDALPAARNGLNSHQRRDTDLGECRNSVKYYFEE